MSASYNNLGEFHHLGTRLARPDRSRRRFSEVAGDDATRNEHAVPSSRTNAAIRAYFDAREAGDTQSAMDAVKDAALGWRADNSAGGVPVFGHLPLPKTLAAGIADDVGKEPPGGGPMFRELLVQLEPGLANQIRSQLESALVTGPQHRSQRDGAFQLLGGDDGDAPSPQPPQRPNSPPQRPASPTPHPKPQNGAEEDKVKCERLKHHYLLVRKKLNEADRMKAKAEARARDLGRQREYWSNEIAELEAELRETHARSTDPHAPHLVCPAERGPRTQPRGRRERRAEQEKMIQEGMCDVIGPIVEEKAADRWREQLERAKARDISELEAELRSVKQKLQAIEPQLAQAQSDVRNAEAEIRFYQGAQGSVVADYEASCGSRGELFQIIP